MSTATSTDFYMSSPCYGKQKASVCISLGRLPDVAGQFELYFGVTQLCCGCHCHDDGHNFCFFDQRSYSGFLLTSTSENYQIVPYQHDALPNRLNIGIRQCQAWPDSLMPSLNQNLDISVDVQWEDSIRVWVFVGNHHQVCERACTSLSVITLLHHSCWYQFLRCPWALKRVAVHCALSFPVRTQLVEVSAMTGQGMAELQHALQLQVRVLPHSNSNLNDMTFQLHQLPSVPPNDFFSEFCYFIRKLNRLWARPCSR